jgi:hypothetical protein
MTVQLSEAWSRAVEALGRRRNCLGVKQPHASEAVLDLAKCGYPETVSYDSTATCLRDGERVVA